MVHRDNAVLDPLVASEVLPLVISRLPALCESAHVSPSRLQLSSHPVGSSPAFPANTAAPRQPDCK